jgi:hypothetical protein
MKIRMMWQAKWASEAEEIDDYRNVQMTAGKRMIGIYMSPLYILIRAILLQWTFQ